MAPARIPGLQGGGYLRICCGEHIDFINVLPFYFVRKRKDVGIWLSL